MTKRTALPACGDDDKRQALLHPIDSPQYTPGCLGAALEVCYTAFFIPFKQCLMHDFLGGPRPVQFRYLVNLHKGATFVFVLGLMAHFDNWSWTAYIYLANHGIYGLLWLLKEATIPDKAWTVYLTIPSTVVSGAGITMYWAAAYIVVAFRVAVPPWLGALSVAVHTFGVTLMMAADTQKYFVLKYKPGLITDGWFAWSRNTNYVGELCVYVSYALLTNHWFPYAWLAFIFVMIWMPNLIAKDISLRRKVGGVAYMRKSGFLLPNVCGCLGSCFCSPKAI
ncbi:Aste57867_1187 [Aphanomyces stellatus]|uniref:Aste57867_1187 protein n=1 Tax=Aphanomyces stellatus TaxID=120398 RepID=A0A485K4R7_9STRA|nr:hypothetical protein As57867_001186 [Aphanomyces stellatus]VFT78407.1 Aste57867_1187 [Aphanomyces stellatus]